MPPGEVFRFCHVRFNLHWDGGCNNPRSIPWRFKTNVYWSSMCNFHHWNVRCTSCSCGNSIKLVLLTTLMCTDIKLVHNFEEPFCLVMISFSSLIRQRRVIGTKSVKYMPFFLSFSLFVNAAVWFTFALLLKDYYILVSFVLFSTLVHVLFFLCLMIIEGLGCSN